MVATPLAPALRYQRHKGSGRFISRHPCSLRRFLGCLICTQGKLRNTVRRCKSDITNSRQLALREKYTLRALLSLGTILPSLLLCLITVIYAHMQNHNAPEIDTIQTWTCKYKNSQPLPQDLGVPGNMGNSGFKSLCQESKFALYGTLVVFLLLGASMAVTVVTWLADKWAARQSRKEGVEMGEKS